MNTVKLFTSQVIPGMIVAEDVFTFNNQMIISKGTVIDDKLITRLKFYSVNTITVNTEEDTQSMFNQPVVSEQAMSEKIKATPEFQYYKSEMPIAVDLLRNQIHDIVGTNAKVDQNALLGNVQSLLKHSRNGIHVFDMLHCLRDFNDQTFAHSLNVAVICYVLGTWLDFPKKDLEVLTLAGLLHDVGKVTLPPAIILKPGRLTAEEYATVKTHAIRGYNILRPKELDNRVKMAAMMHHERCDGSGYPMGLLSDQIDSFAKIVAIADVYEAMTSVRVYRDSICPFEVINLFETEGYTKYDPHYLMCFLEHLNLTYINSSVRLNDKSEGKIVMMNRFALARPIIKVGKKYVDLSSEKTLYIEAII